MKHNSFIKIPDSEYFAIEALSNSGVKRILQTPAHFKEAVSQTESMAFGSLVHCLVLEPENFEKNFSVYPDDINRRTKEGKEQYKLFCDESENKIVIKSEILEQAKNTANSVLNYQFYGVKFSELVKASQKEVAVLWEQEFASGKTLCKSKYDLVSEQFNIIFDVKTCLDASPDGFKRAMYSETLGYYLQSAFYRMPAITKCFKFCFICVEKKAPYAVGIYYADESLMEEAYQKIEQAAELYNHGIKTGEWTNQYNNEPQELSAPGWWYTKQL